MNNQRIMLYAVIATLAWTIVGVLVLTSGDQLGWIALGLGTVTALLGLQAARRHRKEQGR